MLTVAELLPLEATSSRISSAEGPDHLRTYLQRLGAEAVRKQGTTDMSTTVEPSSNAHRQALNLVCRPSAACLVVSVVVVSLAVGTAVHLLSQGIMVVMMVCLRLWTRHWIYEVNLVVTLREISVATSAQTFEAMAVLIRDATCGATYRMIREATPAAIPVATLGTSCEAAHVATHVPIPVERMHGATHEKIFAMNRAVTPVAICKADSVACGSQRWAVAAMVLGRVAWMRPLRPDAELPTPTHQRPTTMLSGLPCGATQGSLQWKEAASIRRYHHAAQRQPTLPRDLRRAGRRPEARWRTRTMNGSPRLMTGLMKGSGVSPSAK